MEANNNKAMREALVKLVDFCSRLWKREKLTPLLEKARAALATPSRQCDVGTVQEQRDRFDNFCKKGKLGRIDLGAYCAYDCPCRNSYDCKLEWGQMPYNESEASHGNA